MDQEFHVIDFKTVTEASDMPAVVRLTARQLMDQPVGNMVGEWLQRLSATDLNMLSAFCDAAVAGDQDALAPIMILGMMFAQCEGIFSDTPEEAVHRSNSMMLFLALESLDRKGAVKFKRELASFGDDAADVVLAELNSIQ